MNNYRTNLQKEADALMGMLPHAQADERGRGVRRLREIADELAALDRCEHWTLEPGETKARIVLRDLSDSHKTIKGG